MVERVRREHSAFEDMLHGLDVIVWEAEPDTLRITFVSDGAEGLLGYPLERWYENDFWAEHIHPDDREGTVAQCRAGVNAGLDHELRYRCVAADGSVRWFRDIVRVEADGDGRASTLRGVMVDITERRAIEDGLRFQAELLDQVDMAVVATDAAGLVTHWNRRAEEMFGWTREEVIGHDVRQIALGPEELRVQEQLIAAAESGRSIEGEFKLWRKDGEHFHGYVRARPVHGAEGEIVGLVGVAVDVTERKRERVQLEQRSAQQAIVAALGQRALEGVPLSRLMDEATFAVSETLDVEIVTLLESLEPEPVLLIRSGHGLDGDVTRGVRIAAGPESQAGLTLETLAPLVSDDLASERRFEIAPVFRERGIASAATVLVPGRRRPFGVLGAYSTRPGAFSGEDLIFLTGVANVLAEAIERWRNEEETRHRALHDPLTGLPNRTLFLDRLGHAIAHCRRQECSLAVYFLDVDHFKLVNDTLGHQAGDDLLGALAPRLGKALRPSDTVARFGGDEFVLLCEDVPDEATALALADRLQAAFRAPFTLGGEQHFATASIGIALARTLEESPEDLIRDADAAMYSAKERGRARHELFDEGMRPRKVQRMQMERDLRLALERDELRLVYQPIVSLPDNRVRGVEALLRWEHPERGTIPPLEFIPLAEASGLIVDLGHWVMRTACAQAVAWQPADGSAPPHTVAINVSPRQLAGGDCAGLLGATLEAVGLPAQAVAVELTESALIEDPDAAAEALQALKDLGVLLVLDDFGTGYSSLAHVHRFPLDALKIDRAFVATLDGRGSPVVTAVLSMARALELDVVAEGVETPAQLEKLRELGCPYAQGYCLARPQPPDEVGQLVGETLACAGTQPAAVVNAG